jgi:hypothetical protein
MSFYAYAATLGTQAVKQVRSISLANNIQTLVDGANGTLTPSIVSLLSASPEASLTTGDLDAVIDNMMSGLEITGGTNVASIPLILANNRGAFQGETSHTIITGAEALAIPTAFEAGHQDPEGELLAREILFSKRVICSVNAATVPGKSTRL